jgi:tetratricopeptide (TPR) repeat protein
MGIAGFAKGQGQGGTPRMAKRNRTWDISGRTAAVIVALLFLGGLALRLAYWFELRASDIRVLLFSESLDSFFYHSWAERIAGGDLMLGDKLFTLSPIYSYLLAPIYILSGSDMFAAILVQLLIGATGILLMYAAGSLLFNRFAGLLAACFTAFYGQYLLTEGLLLTEAFLPTLTAAFVLWTVWALKREQPILFVVSGLIFGLLFSLRPQYFPVVLFLPLFGLVLPFIRQRFIRKNEADSPDWKGILLIFASGAIGVALALAPFAIRNFAATGKPVLLTNSGGMNFYIGNNPEATGSMHAPRGITGSLTGLSEGFAKAAGADQYDEAVSRYWFRKGLEYIANEPSGWLGLMAKKAGLFWNNYEIPLNFDLSVFKHHLRTTRFGFVPFWLVGSLGFVGLFLALRKGEAGWLVVVTAGYFIGTILFFVSARYRVAALPYIILFAAYAVDRFVAYVRRKEWGIVAGTGLLLILALFITVRSNSASVPDSARAAKYRHMAVYFSQQGDMQRAEHWIRQALELQPENPDHWAGLVAQFMQAGQNRRAELAVRDALGRFPRYRGLWMLYSAILARTDRPLEAERAYRTAQEYGRPPTAR